MSRFLILGCLCISCTLLGRAVNQTREESCKKEVTHTRGGSMARCTTDSGLQYEIIQEGTGEYPKKGQTVTVHYTGWLSEDGHPGKKFDSSIDRGQKFSFPIGTGYVIKGWDEGVMLMKEGGKTRFVIPSHLAYGARGAGALIPPHATLIFDVELFSIS